MTTEIRDIRDLFRILEENPEWRTELRRQLLTEELLNLPAQVQALTEAVAENGRQIAENSRILAEHGQLIAENGRQIAENRRRIEELTEVVAENGRQIAENGRQIAENSRILAEHGQLIAENGRQIAENSRILAEHGQLIAENGRQIAENRRRIEELTEVVAENGRQIAENSRILAEHGQLIAENGRQIAENRRRIEELTEVVAENGRQIAENSRILAEHTQLIADNSQKIQNLTGTVDRLCVEMAQARGILLKLDGLRGRVYEEKVTKNLRHLTRDNLGYRRTTVTYGGHLGETDAVSDQFEDAFQDNRISHRELIVLARADFLATAYGPDNGELLIVVGEVSVSLDGDDLSRAQERAQIAARCFELPAKALLVGAEANVELREKAQQEQVGVIIYPE